MAPPESGTAGWPGLFSLRRLLVARSLFRHGELQGRGDFGSGGKREQYTHTTHAKTLGSLGVLPPRGCAVIHYCSTATRSRCRGASGMWEPGGWAHRVEISHARDDEPGQRAWGTTSSRRSGCLLSHIMLLMVLRLRGRMAERRGEVLLPTPKFLGDFSSKPCCPSTRAGCVFWYRTYWAIVT